MNKTQHARLEQAARTMRRLYMGAGPTLIAMANLGNQKADAASDRLLDAIKALDVLIFQSETLTAEEEM